jgi:Predicted metal-dependent phosphoesterases (PHP family)
MKYIDLHIHSNASDGTLSPAQVVSRAVEKDLAAFALTDHDTLSGLPEAQKKAEEYTQNGQPIRVIPGVEISVAYKERDIHILGLFVDINNPLLTDTLEAALQERTTRNEKMVKNLADAGIDISMEKLVESEGDAVLTRAHFAKYLTEHGYTKTTKQAFEKYLDSKGPYYVPRNYISPQKAMEIILASGGLPILAHPLLYHLSDKELDALVSLLKDSGLVGIEAIYSSNIGFQEAAVRKIARTYDLLITGGSDFHGANKPDIEIGSGRGNLKIPYSILEALEEKRAVL